MTKYTNILKILNYKNYKYNRNHVPSASPWTPFSFSFLNRDCPRQSLISAKNKQTKKKGEKMRKQRMIERNVNVGDEPGSVSESQSDSVSAE